MHGPNTSEDATWLPRSAVIDPVQSIGKRGGECTYRPISVAVSVATWPFNYEFKKNCTIMWKDCRLACSPMYPVLREKRGKTRRLDDAVAGTSKIQRFVVTTIERAKTKRTRAIQEIGTTMRLTLHLCMKQ